MSESQATRANRVVARRTLEMHMQEGAIDWVEVQYFYAPTPYLSYSGQQAWLMGR